MSQTTKHPHMGRIELLRANEHGVIEVPPLPFQAEHDRMIERLRKMTKEELFQSKVASGIYNPDGTLTEFCRPREGETEQPIEVCPTCSRPLRGHR